MPIENNFTESTFICLDISFVVLSDGGNIIAKRFFDFEANKISGFPEDFDREKLQKTITDTEDGFTIAKIGKNFYFLSRSGITDSAEEKKSNGKMIFGRVIDSGIVIALERITGCKILSITEKDIKSGEKIYLNKKISRNKIDINISVPAYSSDKALTLNLEMSRDFYTEGIRNIVRFVLISTFGSMLIILIIILFIGKYLSSPFTRLIKEIKEIDMTKSEFKHISERGKSEFAFLRKSINSLLKRIETEHRQVIEAKENLQSILLSVGDGVISVDIDMRIRFMNPAAQKLTGWSIEEALGVEIGRVFILINEYSRKPIENPVVKVYDTNKEFELSNHSLLISKSGEEIPVEDTASPIKNEDGDTIGCVLILRDVSEKKEKQRRIEYLSYHDQLTGLYNRHYFEEELYRYDVKTNLPISFIYADVNGLKTLNDAFGHQSGDKLIQQVAEVFVSECRDIDIIARVGGDEFILLFPKTDNKQVEAFRNKLKNRFKNEHIMGIALSVSLGWSTKNFEDENVWDIIKGAENLMYQKKITSKASKQNAVIKAILNTLELKCPRESDHSKRVSMFCEELGKAYDLSYDEINELKIAGELHDIGKIAVDKSILNKADKLNEAELTPIKSHPETGYRILGTSSEYYKIAEYVLAHHERWDGKGYPKGVESTDIPFFSRIIAVADSFDAMTADRPYRKALSEDEAVSELRINAGTQFDPDIVKVFIEKCLHR